MLVGLKKGKRKKKKEKKEKEKKEKKKERKKRKNSNTQIYKNSYSKILYKLPKNQPFKAGPKMHDSPI